MVSHVVMVKCWANSGLSAWFLGAEWQKTRSRYQKRTRGSFAILAACGIIVSTSFQPCKGGDMACIRGPLEASLLGGLSYEVMHPFKMLIEVSACVVPDEGGQRSIVVPWRLREELAGLLVEVGIA